VPRTTSMRARKRGHAAARSPVRQRLEVEVHPAHDEEDRDQEPVPDGFELARTTALCSPREQSYDDAAAKARAERRGELVGEIDEQQDQQQRDPNGSWALECRLRRRIDTTRGGWAGGEQRSGDRHRDEDEQSKS